MPELIEVTCNHRVNPIGVGANPVFAWKLKGAARQQSYRIFVWEGKNAAWDSGEILSNDTCGIEYGGTPLKARTQYRYRVAVTADGVRLESGEQTFETALLNGFSARWLAQPPVTRRLRATSNICGIPLCAPGCIFPASAIMKSA